MSSPELTSTLADFGGNVLGGNVNGMRTRMPAKPAQPAQQSQMIQPSYLSDLFQGALPQVEASQIGAPQAAGYLSQGAPSAEAYLSQGAGDTDAYGVDASGYGADPLIAQILAGMSPIFDQQQRALSSNLANAGIIGGSTVGAGTDLANNQITQLLAQIVPAIQASQQLNLGAQQFNAGAQNQNSQFNAMNDFNQNQFNAGVQNQNAQYNAGNQLQNNQFNAGVLNNNSQYNANNQMSAGQYNATAYDNASRQNAQNALNAAQYDAGVNNTLTSQIMGYNNQDYIQRMNNQLSLAQNNQNNQTQAFQPNYMQAAPVNFSGLAGAFGSTQVAQPGQKPTYDYSGPQYADSSSYSTKNGVWGR